MRDELTAAERSLIATLPGPPEMGSLQASHIWIVEWLPNGERQTGRELHDWMRERRKNWSVYFSCQTKDQVIEAITKATMCAQRINIKPVLHIESHGDTDGLEGPDANGGREFLAWDELIEPLQMLNRATRCNLLVFVAACIGFAAIQALTRGPLAPAVALVGPDANIAPQNLLWGTKEFYRRWLGESPRLTEMAESASREAGAVIFEPEPFVILAYDSFIEQWVKSIRPIEINRRKIKLRDRMLQETGLPESEIDRFLDSLPPFPPWEELQKIWDKMFMIDLYPENQERFGLDVKGIVSRIVESQLLGN